MKAQVQWPGSRPCGISVLANRGWPAGRSNGTASASRLLASVSIAPSPSRQRATTAFGPITSAASARAPSRRGTIAVARNAMSRR